MTDKELKTDKEKIEALTNRVELLEQRLIDLAARCWPHCGDSFAKELQEEIIEAKR